MSRTSHDEFVVESQEPAVRRSRFCGLRDFCDLADLWLSASRFGHFFRLGGSGHPQEIVTSSVFREVRAGLTTFATMAYIIAVNCDSIPKFVTCKEGELGFDTSRALLTSSEVRRDLITATAAIAGMATLVFGLLTNLPVAIAPGMGLNAYFAFQVVGVNGSGSIPYRTALTAIFIEGFIFILLALTGMRQWLVKIIPATLKTATGVGIGFLLTEVGLSYSSGIGAITGGGGGSPLTLGGCPKELLDPASGMCTSGQMSSPKLWLGVFCGGIFTAFLMAYRIKYALVIGIALVSVISWPVSRNTAVTYFPNTEEGDSRFEFFKQVVAWHPLSRVANQLEWDIQTSGSNFALALFTFLYVDIIDATATLYSMVRFCGVVDKDGDFPRSTIAYCTDAAFISVSALLGSSPVTAFIESGAGIAEGGRTGLTAVVTGLCFIVAVFFAPIFASIPPWATGCTLVLITQINWRYIGDVLPSFVVMTFIPFSYSVAYGLIASGIFVYTMLNGLIGAMVYISGGRCEPREYELKEYWSWKGSGQPPWFVRAIRHHSKKAARDVSTPAGVPEFRSPRQERVVSFSGDSQGRSSAKVEAATVVEQPILSRPTPEQMTRMS
ncbi:putative xanthine/uracil permease [Beauveria bassiana]|uniref:Putative xanthine/uracil permease n=1 Tax=Beauveria bassiana TaxID=176275 RepID=A0A2N6NL94_BEABA|nr:putative xanthine/uracil permease [Beauveria bassiana]